MMTRDGGGACAPSVRAFLDRPVERATIERRYWRWPRGAPSGGNLSPGMSTFWPATALADAQGDGPPQASPPTRPARAPSSPSIRRRSASRGGAAASPRASSSTRRSASRARTGRRGSPSSPAISTCSERRSACSSRSPASFGPPQWAHLGMFMQNVMLLAEERGLATCAQEAWALVHKTVGEVLGLPEDRLFYCGMALGHADRGPSDQRLADRARAAGRVRDVQRAFDRAACSRAAGSGRGRRRRLRARAAMIRKKSTKVV